MSGYSSECSVGPSENDKHEAQVSITFYDLPSDEYLKLTAGMINGCNICWLRRNKVCSGLQQKDPYSGKNRTLVAIFFPWTVKCRGKVVHYYTEFKKHCKFVN